MLQIRYLTPADPGIRMIAEKYNLFNKNKSLFTLLKLAERKNCTPREIINTSNVLISGERELTSGNPNVPKNARAMYLDAVAYAQRRLKRKDEEVIYLKRLVLKNYSEPRQVEVFNTFIETANKIRLKSETAETNYLNYLIDCLISLLQTKMEIFKSGFNLEEIPVEGREIMKELTSGEHGFKIRRETAHRISKLLIEAAKTPWRINEGK